MSLTTCLQRAGSALNQDDKRAILDRSRTLRQEGKNASEASVQAVQEQLDAVQAMLPRADEGEMSASARADASAVNSAERSADEKPSLLFSLSAAEAAKPDQTDTEALFQMNGRY